MPPAPLARRRVKFRRAHRIGGFYRWASALPRGGTDRRAADGDPGQVDADARHHLSARFRRADAAMLLRANSRRHSLSFLPRDYFSDRPSRRYRYGEGADNRSNGCELLAPITSRHFRRWFYHNIAHRYS